MLLILVSIIVIVIFVIVKLLTNENPNKLYASIGKKKAIGSNLILSTCVRNCNRNIKNIVNFYKYFSRYFNKVKLLVMENDSSDNTRRNLLKLKDKIDIDVIGCGINSNVCNMNLNDIKKGHSKHRVRRMAIIRNILLDHIKSIQHDYNYCIMLDGDISGKINTDGFLESIYHLEDKKIDAIACYGIDMGILNTRVIYDVFALEKFDCSNKLYNISFAEGGKEIYKLSLAFRKGLIKVKSAFNGMAIYKLPFADNIRYSENTIVCEHVSFHKKMNMYINRNFIFDINKH